MLYQFKRFAHLHRSDLPAQDNYLDWFALIQRYGGPTRLLDFTYSAYVAAFFAVESAAADSAVWAINLSTLEAAGCDRLKYSAWGAIDEIRQGHNRKFQTMLEKVERTPAVLHVEQDRMYERLWIQKGLFLAPTEPNMPFQDNLIATFGGKTFPRKKEELWTEDLNERTYKEYDDAGYLPILKIVLPQDIHSDVLDDLEAMNISAATLFPGLEGAARSLKGYV